ncbi:MAG: ABC transporter permease [Elusimicrobia bacterium]|nr:ABC transporter permease [Elusimicrobiota bacterium]
MIHARIITGLIRKEFIQIFCDPKMIMVLFFIPVVQLIMFGLALTSEVKNIRLAVVGKPSAISREIQTRAAASGWFVTDQIPDGANVENPVNLLNTRRAEAVLVAPPEGFEYALERRNKPVQLLINATNAQRAQQVNQYVSQIVARVAAGRGYNINAPLLLAIDTRILFNPQLNTTDFMVPALLVMAGFIVLMIVCSMAITKEKETGTMEKLISSPATTADILLGKTIPYFILGMGIVALMLCVGIFGFKIAYRGTVWQLALNGTALAACALSLATLLSTIAKTQQQAMMGGVLFLLPGILLSGVFFPVANIPAAFRWMCYLNPLMYACLKFRNIILKGGDYPLFWLYFAILSGMALVLAFSAYKNFKAKLN